MSDNTVTLAHGAGGKQTSELIEKVFKAHFSNPEFTADDAAVLPEIGSKLAFTTDGFIVSPWKFNGGNIGKLSICGTVNDLSCMGAKPMYMTCAFVIEEGFPLDSLEEIAAAMGKTAAEVGVKIVAGDTKVAGKGQVDKVFITTTGIGSVQEGANTSGKFAEPGDAVIVEGNRWHDNKWGKCSCDRCRDKESLNLMGNLLMKIRSEIIAGKLSGGNDV